MARHSWDHPHRSQALGGDGSASPPGASDAAGNETLTRLLAQRDEEVAREEARKAPRAPSFLHAFACANVRPPHAQARMPPMHTDSWQLPAWVERLDHALPPTATTFVGASKLFGGGQHGILTLGNHISRAVRNLSDIGHEHQMKTSAVMQPTAQPPVSSTLTMTLVSIRMETLWYEVASNCMLWNSMELASIARTKRCSVNSVPHHKAPGRFLFADLNRCA